MKSAIRKPKWPIRWMKPVKDRGKAISRSKKSKGKSGKESEWNFLLRVTVLPWRPDQEVSSPEPEPLPEPGRDADGFWILKRKGGGNDGV